jgi:large subunit ribosomal protein L29
MPLKKLKMSELNDLSPEELHDKKEQLKKNLMRSRFQAKTGKLERQSEIRETKRDIARVLTAVSIQRQQSKEEPIASPLSGRAKSKVAVKKSDGSSKS